MCIRDRCQAELKGVKLKDYAGTKRKFEHGLWDVDGEEDFALCEFVDPSKIEMQQIIRDGINLMIKEA